MAPQSKASHGKKAPAQKRQVQRQPRAVELMTYQRRPMNPPSGYVHHHHTTVQYPPSVQQRPIQPSDRQTMRIQRIQQDQQALKKQIAANRRQHEEQRQAFARQQASWAQERRAFAKQQQDNFEYAQQQFETGRVRDQREREQWKRNTRAMLANERAQWERQQNEKEASRQREWEIWEKEQRERCDKAEEDRRRMTAILASGAAVGVGIGAGLALTRIASDRDEDDQVDDNNNDGSISSDDGHEDNDEELENNSSQRNESRSLNDESNIEMQQYASTGAIDQSQLSLKDSDGEDANRGTEESCCDDWCNCGGGDSGNDSCWDCCGGGDGEREESSWCC